MMITAQMKAGVIADGGTGCAGIVNVGTGCTGRLIVAAGIVIGGMVNVGVGAGGAGGAAVAKEPTLTGPATGWVTCTDQK